MHEINDISFVGVVNPEAGEVGYDLFVGGGLSTNPMFAKRLGVFVRPEQVHEVWKGVISGLPRLRLPPAAAPRARIKFLISDWGAEKFRDVLQKEYLGYELPDGPPPAPPKPPSATTSASTARRTATTTSGSPRGVAAGSTARS